MAGRKKDKVAVAPPAESTDLLDLPDELVADEATEEEAALDGIRESEWFREALEQRITEKLAALDEAAVPDVIDLEHLDGYPGGPLALRRFIVHEAADRRVRVTKALYGALVVLDPEEADAERERRTALVYAARNNDVVIVDR